MDWTSPHCGRGRQRYYPNCRSVIRNEDRAAFVTLRLIRILRRVSFFVVASFLCPYGPNRHANSSTASSPTIGRPVISRMRPSVQASAAPLFMNGNAAAKRPIPACWRNSRKILGAREDLIAVETMRHQQLAQGGVLKLPVHDQQGPVMRDENGDVVFEEVVVHPNRQALETRLRWMASDRFPGNRAKRSAPPDELPPPSEEYAKPRQAHRLDEVLAHLQARAIKSKQSKTTAKEDEEANPPPVESDKD